MVAPLFNGLPLSADSTVKIDVFDAAADAFVTASEPAQLKLFTAIRRTAKARDRERLTQLTLLAKSPYVRDGLSRLIDDLAKK